MGPYIKVPLVSGAEGFSHDDFVVHVINVRDRFSILSVIVLDDDLLPSFLDVLPVGFEWYGMDRVTSKDKLHGRSPHTSCVYYSSTHCECYSAKDSVPTSQRPSGRLALPVMFWVAIILWMVWWHRLTIEFAWGLRVVISFCVVPISLTSKSRSSAWNSVPLSKLTSAGIR
jgi:hypothetical protein